jgi:hypothetical protein
MSDTPSKTPRKCLHPRINTDGTCIKCGVQTERTIEQLEQENATLRELAEGLKADKERLDWLEKAPDQILDWANGDGAIGITTATLVRGIHLGTIRFDNEGKLTDEDVPLLPLRAALDDAIARYRAACPGEGK